jgi:hypothetical protein
MPQNEAGLARLGGLAENISPFKGVALNINNVNALPNALQSQGSVERTSQPRDAQSQLSSARQSSKSNIFNFLINAGTISKSYSRRGSLKSTGIKN